MLYKETLKCQQACTLEYPKSHSLSSGRLLVVSRAFSSLMSRETMFYEGGGGGTRARRRTQSRTSLCK